MITEAIEKARTLLNESDLSIREIAVESGISHATLYSIVNGECDPRFSTLVKLFEYFGEK